MIDKLKRVKADKQRFSRGIIELTAREFALSTAAKEQQHEQEPIRLAVLAP
jgi:hypothetical protein